MHHFLETMSNWYVFCDICGKRCLASKTTKLTTYTGKPGVIVCYKDRDQIDYGLVSYTIPKERSVSWTRINHTDKTNSSPFVDVESMTYSYFLAASQDDLILSPSQNEDAGLTVNEPI